MNKKVIVSSVIIVALYFVSCGPVPFSSVVGGKVAVSFHGESGSANKGNDEKELIILKEDSSEVDKASLGESDYTGWFDAYYSDFGTYYGSYTPDKMSIACGAIYVMNENQAIEIASDDLGYFVDFTDPSQGTAEVETTKVKYESIYISFSAVNELGMSAIIETPGITLETADPAYLNDLGGNRYEITHLNALHPLPAYVPTGFSSLSDFTGPSFQYIIFSTNVDSPTLWVPSSATDLFETVSITENPYITSNTNFPVFLIPWEGMAVPSTAKGVTVALVLNTKDLIEVYDVGGGTYRPIMANKFWERFSLDVEYNY